MKSWIASSHVPTRAELDGLAAKFFVRSDAAAVALLDERLRGIVADKSLLAQQEDSYRGNCRDGHGLLWYEQFSRKTTLPSPVELALWLGSLLPDFPSPRTFCPPQLVGSWAGEATTWTFGADGAFRCTEQVLSKLTAWCVHLTEGNADLRREELWLYAGELRLASPRKLIISSVTEGALDLVKTGGSFPDVRYHLTRSR